MDDRLTIANMGIEMGAKIAVFPVDKITKTILEKQGVHPDQTNAVWADEDASYIRELTYRLDEIEPVVSFPHTVDHVKKIKDVEGMEIQQGLIGTCTNGRLSDFEEAVKILEGKTISQNCRLLLLPASKSILLESNKKGWIEKLIRAGGVLLPPGCGPCLGAHQGALAPGERCISTANRNFKGRMGCKEAEIVLASPATVAASALNGKITDPRKEV
jgi:homoaconitase/3-isopropylmalate dehydratase large subunit